MPERRLLHAALVAWGIVAILGVLVGPPLGHDESAFASAARGDAPAWLYRSTGVIAIAKIGLGLGASDAAMRIVPVLVSFSIIIGVWLVGSRAFDERVGAWAAAVAVGAHPMALRSAELIGDLPATGCLLVGIAMLVSELKREDGPRWRIVSSGVAFAAGFYLRYGSLPVIGVAGLAAAALWWRSIVKRPLPVIAAAVVFAVLLVPHVLHSIDETGSVLGVLDVARKMPRRDYVGEGLVTYFTSNPFSFYGGLVAPVMLAGLVAIVRPPTTWRPTIYLGVIAIGQFLAIGIESHAQPRYVYVATALLVVLGVDAVRRVAAAKQWRIARVAGGLVALAWLAVAVIVVPYDRHLANEREPIVVAAQSIVDDSAGRPCVIGARVVTQLMWYARCHELLIHADGAVDPWPVGSGRRYLVSLPHQVIDPQRAARGATLRQLPLRGAERNDKTSVWSLDAP